MNNPAMSKLFASPFLRGKELALGRWAGFRRFRVASVPSRLHSPGETSRPGTPASSALAAIRSATRAGRSSWARCPVPAIDSKSACGIAAAIRRVGPGGTARSPAPTTNSGLPPRPRKASYNPSSRQLAIIASVPATWTGLRKSRVYKSNPRASIFDPVPRSNRSTDPRLADHAKIWGASGLRKSRRAAAENRGAVEPSNGKNAPFKLTKSCGDQARSRQRRARMAAPAECPTTICGDI